MKKIVVIGAGTMGNGIAHTFAQNGFQVNLIDISEEALEKGIQTISTNLDRMIAREKISVVDKNETLFNINKFTSTQECVKEVELVIKAATDNVDLKFKIFKQLAKYPSNETILASSTSSLSISLIASVPERPDMVIATHFT